MVEDKGWTRNIKSMNLRDLETSIQESNKIHNHKLDILLEELKQAGLKKGRVRPRHPTETRLLQIIEERRLKRIEIKKEDN